MVRNILIICALVLVAIGIAWAAGATSVLSQGEVENSETYLGTQKYVDTDTTGVNGFVITAIGPVHVVVRMRVYAANRWSGYAILDSFKTTSGDVRFVGGITNDSIMRIWLPPLAFVADTNKIRARSFLKQTSKFFQWRIEAVAQSADNGGALDISWVQ